MPKEKIKLKEVETTVVRVEVEKVEWLYRDGRLISDKNDHPIAPVGGKYYPGAKISDGGWNDTIKVRVKIKPEVEGAEVFLKEFDPDDPSADNNEVDSDESGGDNRGGRGSLAATSGKTDEKGEFITSFRVAHQPGDNHRVAATCCGETLDLLDDDNVPASDEQVMGFCGRVTRLLTVWRMLHYELDRMARPKYEENIIKGYWYGLERFAGDPGRWAKYHVYLSRMKVISTGRSYDGVDEEFRGGFFRFWLPFSGGHSIIGNVQHYDDRWWPFGNYAEVWVLYPHDFRGHTEGEFEMSDDDVDESTFKERRWGSVEVPWPWETDRDFHEKICDAYAHAYITAYNDPAWNDDGISFERNTSEKYLWQEPHLYAKIGERKSVEGSASFRKITIGYLFQPSVDHDKDPAMEVSTLGYTPYINLATDDLRCAIFWATVYDVDSEAVQKEWVYFAHEMCHALTGPGHDGRGIMKAEPKPTKFAPRSLAALREDF